MQYLIKRIERNGKVFTSLRFKKKEWDAVKGRYPNVPIRENSRYVYLEIRGDLLNLRRAEK